MWIAVPWVAAFLIAPWVLPLNHPWVKFVMSHSLLLMVGVPVTANLVYYRLQVHRLKATGYRLCVHCDYKLTGLDDKGECPECGHPFDVAAVRTEWERGNEHL